MMITVSFHKLFQLSAFVNTNKNCIPILQKMKIVTETEIIIEKFEASYRNYKQ
jgi:hypothetical protein